MIEVQDVPEARIKEWNDFVFSHPDATYVHQYGWAAAIGRSYGFRVFHLAATKGERIIAVLPAVAIKRPFASPSAICLPFSGYAGPLLAPDYDVYTVLSIFQRYLQIEGIPRLELWQPCGEEAAFGEECTLKLRLPDSAEKLWRSFDSKVRNLIRKGERSGVTLQWGIEQLDDFYEVYSQNMSRLGTPVHSRFFFSEICSNLEQGIDVLTVRKDRHAIAAMVVAKFQRKLADPWASSLHQFNHLSPNMLLYWEVLRYGCENGYEEFDFGRSRKGSGTFSFKKQWGAVPFSLEVIRVTAQGASRTDAAQIYRGKAARAFSAAWMLLPLPIAGWLGPKLRKFLP
ncbi:MAG: GNAT family N-acetyltransferase [Ignavibacteriales bacterium]|nr:GNAT family N-acetyltransferase [Ignavibacteriales bacterium]